MRRSSIVVSVVPLSSAAAAVNASTVVRVVVCVAAGVVETFAFAVVVVSDEVDRSLIILSSLSSVLSLPLSPQSDDLWRVKIETL